MKSFGTEIGKHLSNNCIFIYLTRPIFLYYRPVKKNVFTSVNKIILYTHPRFWVDAPMVSICKSYFASLLSYHIHPAVQWADDNTPLAFYSWRTKESMQIRRCRAKKMWTQNNNQQVTHCTTLESLFIASSEVLSTPALRLWRWRATHLSSNNLNYQFLT